MRSWLPEKGEKWVFQVRVESIRRVGDLWYVRYRPLFLQQQGAPRELDENAFVKLFTPFSGSSKEIIPGSCWVLPVDVVGMNRKTMVVDYMQTRTSTAGDLKQVGVHVFRATFRRENPPETPGPDPTGNWSREREEWRATQKMPQKGDRYMLDVKVEDVMAVDGRKQIKYIPLDQQAGTAPRVMDETVFRETFEPLDGAVQQVKKGDEWFMMVEVTDFDSEENTYWYRQVSSRGVPRGDVRQLSDHIFMATFRRTE